MFYHVSDVFHRQTDVMSFPVCPCFHLGRHTWIHSSVHNTWELRSLLFALGERREAHEAGEASLDGPLSAGLTLFPELLGWAAAAGWKKSAGRWKTGEDRPPPALQLPPSPSERRRSQFYFKFTFVILKFIFLFWHFHLEPLKSLQGTFY